MKQINILTSKIFPLCIFAFLSISSIGQTFFTEPNIHSHNDYLQKKPLLRALKANAKSIEADVFLIDGEIYVAHTRNEVNKKNTFEQLYVLPLKQYLSKQDKKPGFHIMIDVKSEAVSTLEKIQETLLKYPGIFSKDGIHVVISGNRPDPADYKKYAPFIFFDGRNPIDAEGPDAKKIAVISQDLSMFTHWRGTGKLPENEKQKIIGFVNSCHEKNKPVRFWNSGDNENMYNFLRSIGADYINTDSPQTVRDYLNQSN